MNQTEKINKACPMISDGDYQEQCLGSSCQWWTNAWTTERVEIWNCCEVIKAHLNSEGRYVV